MDIDMKDTLDHFFFKGIKISDIGWPGLRRFIDETLSNRKSAYVCLTDVGNVMMAQHDSILGRAINRSQASIADGTPLAWFGQLTGHKEIERISGVDLFQRLLHTTRYRHFLLGDTTETHRKVIAKAKRIDPEVHIDGYSPPFKPNFGKSDNDLMLSKIRDSGSDIVWVSFGGGKQEKWMMDNVANLDRCIMIGVGAAFKYYTGELGIPPRLIQRMGLQWTTRLRKNPMRWMTKGQFKFRVLFSLYFPFEFAKARCFNKS